jgi:non-ribosomal peptide synthetase component F
LLNGAALLPRRVSDEGAASLCDWLRAEEISVYHSVPLVFRNLASAMVDHHGLPGMRLVKLGGDAISRVEVDLFKRHFPAPSLLYVGLGASEMNSIRYFLIDHRTEFDGHIAPVGFAAEDTEVVLLDDDLNEVPEGEPGEIAVKSPYLFSGYWRRPDLTGAAFMPDPRGCGGRVFRIGDLGRMLPGGVLLHLGRKDFQIKIRGVRIEPGEVERVLLDFPEVRECVVMAREDESGENRLVAFWSQSADPRLVPLWGHLARGGAVQHPLPGSHADVLAPEHLPALVKSLRTALDRACEHPSTMARP